MSSARFTARVSSQQVEVTKSFEPGGRTGGCQGSPLPGTILQLVEAEAAAFGFTGDGRTLMRTACGR
jgi:hypothetical protein